MRNVFSFLKNDADVGILVAQLLRIGVISASVVAFIGGVMYLKDNAFLLPEYHVFNGAPKNVRDLPDILSGVFALKGASIIQFGVVILLATPILRIVFSALAFAVERDYLYVFITLIVLSVILTGVFGGLKL